MPTILPDEHTSTNIANQLPRRFNFMRVIYFSLGSLFFCVGFIGVFLPVLPTTPFMILALWGFSRSSPRFHNWLYTHQIFGPPLQQWRDFRVIPPLAKFFSILFMMASLTYLHLYLIMPLWIDFSVTITMVIGGWYILTKPSYPPEK